MESTNGASDGLWPASSRNDLTPRQEEILQRLEEIVVRRGFRQLTLQDLTSELHCSRTILYALAPTKEELALVVIDRFLGRLGAAMNRAIENADTPRSRLADALDELAALSEPVSRQFFDDIGQYAPARALHVRHSIKGSALLRRVIDEGTQEGAFNPVNAQFAAEVIGLVMAGITDGSLLERTDSSSAEAVGQLKRMLLEGLISNGRVTTVKRRTKHALRTA